MGLQAVVDRLTSRLTARAEDSREEYRLLVAAAAAGTEPSETVILSALSKAGKSPAEFATAVRREIRLGELKALHATRPAWITQRDAAEKRADAIVEEFAKVSADVNRRVRLELDERDRCAAEVAKAIDAAGEYQRTLLQDPEFAEQDAEYGRQILAAQERITGRLNRAIFQKESELASNRETARRYDGETSDTAEEVRSWVERDEAEVARLKQDRDDTARELERLKREREELLAID